MSTFGQYPRRHPALRLRELGPHHQRSIEHSLSQELHRRFDSIAAERLPSAILALIDRLQLGPKQDAGPNRRPRAS